MIEIEEEYAIISRDIDFVANSCNPLDSKINTAAYFLALSKVLENYETDQHKFKKIALEIATEIQQSKSLIERIRIRLAKIGLRSTSMKKRLLNFDPRISLLFNSEGFKAHPVQMKINKKETVFGFDVLECGICKLFRRYNAEVLLTVMCEVDDILSSLPGLPARRHSSLAAGHEKCDFRF